MPDIKKKRFSLVEAISRQMTKGPAVRLGGSKHYYPSEASVEYIDRHDIRKVVGACLRQPYLRITGEAKPAKHSIHSEWIFALGKAVEVILVEQIKRAGIWVDNNIKFYNPEYNISGEIDCIIRDPETDELCCCEIKSFYGYMASKQIMGTRTEPGRPKTSQMLQLLIYLKETQGQIPYGRLVYAARDSSDRKDFIIEIWKDDQGVEWPMVNGTVDYRFPVSAIYDRLRTLDGYIQRRELPPNDYEMVWSPAKVEKMYSIGDLGKTKYEKWKKNPTKYPCGNWNCSYCQYTNFCWNKDGTPKVQYPPMKDKKVEAAIKQLFKLVHPYLRGRKCSIVFSSDGDIDIGFIQSVQVKMDKPRVSVIFATDEQVETLTNLIRNPKMGKYLVEEYNKLILQGRLSKKKATKLIQECIDYLRDKNHQRNPNLKPLVQEIE